MRPSNKNIDLVLGQLAYFEKLYGAVLEDGEGRLTISSRAAHDVILDCVEITNLCDSTPLPEVLIPAASAIGDAAYLLGKALEDAEEIETVASSEAEEDQSEFGHFFKEKKRQIEYIRVVKNQTFRDAGDHARKGRELLRAPAREAGIEISSTLP